MKNHLETIDAARAAIFQHVGAKDEWPALAILDVTDNPWFATRDSLRIWPEGYQVTDPDDEPDCDETEEEMVFPHLMRGPEFTLAIGHLRTSQQELWLLDNAKG